MTVYLLHFNRPISDRALHYLGFAKDLDSRIEAHRNGNGARLTQVARERGIGFDVVRVWKKGNRTLERKLKNRKNASKLCPICQKEKGLKIAKAKLKAMTWD